MFAEFYAFTSIKTIVTKITNQFLDQAGFLKVTIDKESKRKRLKTDISKRGSIDPYIAHSASSTLSAQSHISDNIAEEKQQSNYLTWWDPNRQTMFYIDPSTGTSFLSPPPPPPPPPPSILSSQGSLSSSLQRNVIDRSHLKRSRQSSEVKSVLDLQSKNNKSWLPRSPYLENSYKLSKQDLKNATLLNQVDKKFIALQLRDPKILVMIDQHAADERIKLEEMISTGIQSTTLLEPSIVIELDSFTEFETLKNDDRILKCLKMWGIQIIFPSVLQNNVNSSFSNNAVTLSQSRFFDTSQKSPHFQKCKIYITHIPQLITDRCISDHSILKNIIREHMYWIIEQTDEFAITNTCPRGILEILKSRACRSAIMFNDELNRGECSTIVKKLSVCNFPFQCAHGRPSAIPIQLNTSSSIPHTTQRSTNWDRFKR